ncbi:MAG: phosphate ABC transporter permease subunit PstC [Phycisphaerales bacterium]|nr:phosphate ABC transporter permease subunit PstC [Phycisphaerales bacterium]
MLRPRPRRYEILIRSSLALAALLTVAITLAIIAVLFGDSLAFFRHVSMVEFVFGLRWAPDIEPLSFGVLPLACGTLLVAAGALLFALPIGVPTAIFLSEYSPRWLRQVAKPVLEILAGIPSVVYGYFAATFVTPLVLKPLFGPERVDAFNAASAALVLGVMILPTICSLCDDAFRSVPVTLREAAYALSATRLEVSTRVVFPAALSGVVAAVLLALARAIGETMAVALAAGSNPQLTLNPFQQVQTMTGYMAQVSMGETAAGSIKYEAIFAIGLTLFAITFSVNWIARRILKRFREVYE